MSYQNNRGFTLIELLLVIVIISILGAMAAQNLAGKSEQARLTAAKTDIEGNIAAALDMYEIDNGGYPTTDQGLKALLVAPSAASNWNGPYLKTKRIPQDPWGNDYYYSSPGSNNTNEYDLSSGGPDGQSGGGDDIVNWFEG